MKEARREKSYSSDKKKKKKKHKKKHVSRSSDSESTSMEKMWVEASSSNNEAIKNSKKQKKKHKRKYVSPTSDSESTDMEEVWVEASSLSNVSNKDSKKKEKKLKKYTSSSSDSESSSHDTSKIESPSSPVVMDKRESWMNEELFVPTLSKKEMISGSSSRQRRADHIKEMREKEEEIRKERELNPHLKNDVTDLPEKASNIESLNLPSSSVGDGGYSWLKKAYYRIQEQAQREGRSMEDVAVERWGSLSKLKSMIEEAEERMMKHPKSQKNYFRSHHRNRHAEGEEEQRSHADRFKKPRDSQESGRSSYFDRSKFQFEYRKPDNENRRDKKLNQFKSSRPSKFYDYGESVRENENTDSSSSSKYLNDERLNEIKQQDSKTMDTKNSSNRERIPAWKKPKYVEEEPKEKNTMKNSEPEINYSTPEKCVKSTDSEADAPEIFSDDDLSKLAARQIKAEIMGDKSLALKLKQQLDEARKRVKEKGFDMQSHEKIEEVVLTKLGSKGQAQPIQTTSEKILDAKQKKSKKYFEDDSKYSLKQMFEREKLTTADDQMEMFVEAASQYDETSEIDFEIGNTSKKLSQKMSSSRQEEKDIFKAMSQHKKRNEKLEKCQLCRSHVEQYLVVDEGKQVYVCLPKFKPLTEGHCLIIPWSHVPSFLSLDEDVWQEIDEYKNMLRNLFRPKNRCIIFMETSMNFRRYPHAVLECIPVPEEESNMAPFYFKKAIQESEAEWAHNKKLIDLKNKGLRHSVPKNLPYFHVEFDPKVHAGFAHVIEDEKYFPPNFGKEIIGGMLNIDYNYLYKNKREEFTPEKSKEVIEFKKMWHRFKNDNT